MAKDAAPCTKRSDAKTARTFQVSKLSDKGIDTVVENAKAKGKTQFSVSENIENFDNSLYNEIELPIAEQKRVQSEALTWNANKRNQIITQTLSNGITYRYAIDDEGIVHIYGKEKSVNIHDWKEDYGNTNTTRPDSITEELWLGYGNGSRDSSFSQDGRKPSKDDTNDNRFVSGKGRSNGTGYSKNRTNANRKPKGWHFFEDGSVEITYSDGTKEIGNDSQINETKADLNGSASFMPDDIAPVRKSLSNTDEQSTTVGTPLKDLAFDEDIAPVRDDVNYQNQGTNVSQEFAEQSIKSFGISKPNDYIHVQRQVFSTLQNEGFFTDSEARSRTDVNEETGMVIETNKSGIFETFSFNNYANLGKTNKAIKLATIRKLPEIIKKGKLKDNNVNNYHKQNSGTSFAYIQSVIEVDDKYVSVQIDIKKSPQKNKFWVHRIDILEKANEFPADAKKALKQGIDYIGSNGSIINPNENVKNNLLDGTYTPLIEEDVAKNTTVDDIAPVREDLAKNKTARVDKDYVEGKNLSPRKKIHNSIIENIKAVFKGKGFDFDTVLENAKNLSTFATVDNIPQRVMEKSLGYKEGQILSDLTVNKVAQNETEGIKWLNSYTERKNGILAQLSKKYNIKPGSKESAAAQTFKFYI